LLYRSTLLLRIQNKASFCQQALTIENNFKQSPILERLTSGDRASIVG
jgi:hypothetical protein